MTTNATDRHPAVPAIDDRGRILINDWFKAFNAGTFPSCSLELVQRMTLTNPSEIMPALIDLLNGEDQKKELLAALIISYFKSQLPLAIPKLIWVRVEQSLMAIFRKGDIDRLTIACGLLAFFTAPKILVADLTALLKHPNRELAVLSAAALSRRSDTERLAALPVLIDAFRSDNNKISDFAGIILLKIGVHQGDVIRRLNTRLCKMATEYQHAILTVIREVGLEASELADAVAQLLEDTDVNLEIRRCAAVTLGKIVPESKEEEFRSRLRAVMNGTHWQVISGVAEAFAERHAVPPGVICHLAQLLSHQNPDMRRTAAIGLTQIGDRATLAISPLVAQLAVERDKTISDSIILALATIGPPAVPSLIEMLGNEDILVNHFAVKTLANMGPAGVQTFTPFLRTSSNIRVLEGILSAIYGMGKRAAPAVPILGQMLSETDNEQHARTIIIAIAACGTPGFAAIPFLIECIAKRQDGDEISALAKRALANFGKPAFTSLESAIERSNSEPAKRRLERALQSMRPISDESFKQFERLQDDELIESFLAIGDVFIDHGAISWAKVSRLLQQKHHNQKRGTAKSTLRIQVQKLERRLKVGRLTTHETTKPGTLTELGRKIYAQAKDYLAAKRGDSK